MNSSIDSRLATIDMQAMLNVYNAQVDAGRCSRAACPACNAQDDLSRKDIRRRQLRYFDYDPKTKAWNVVVCKLRLARWKCGNCTKCFSDYPDFRPPLQTLRVRSINSAGSGLPGRRR